MLAEPAISLASSNWERQLEARLSKSEPFTEMERNWRTAAAKAEERRFLGASTTGKITSESGGPQPKIGLKRLHFECEFEATRTAQIADAAELVKAEQFDGLLWRATWRRLLALGSWRRAR